MDIDAHCNALVANFHFSVLKVKNAFGITLIKYNVAYIKFIHFGSGASVMYIRCTI